MTDEQLGNIYHTARNADTFRDFKRVALDILSASIAAPPAPSVADAAGASGRVRALFIENPPDELGPSDEPESQYRLGYNTALEDAIDAIAKESGNELSQKLR